jgi:HrpA-like RNA helicase
MRSPTTVEVRVKNEMRAMTKPAAMTTARRIAQEMGVTLGGTVGYHVRYDKCASSSTVIKVEAPWWRMLRFAYFLMALKVVTDGILLREMQSDFLLTKYRRVCRV